MKEWRIVLAALVIFASGVVTGALTFMLSKQLSGKRDGGPFVSQNPRAGLTPGSFNPRHEAQIRDLMRRMDGTLELTPDQRERILGIVTNSQHRMQQIFQEMAPRTREEFRALHGRIRSELQPWQQREFDRLTRPRNRPHDGSGTFRSRPGTNSDPISKTP